MINKIHNLFKKLRHIKSRNIFVASFILIVAFFVVGYTNATVGTAIATMIGWVLFGIAWSLGQLLVLMMEILVWIAQWSTFISAPAVGFGWKIVRDICNMFFVVIMLVIAFATVLRVEKYSYEKLLPKLIIMAILINFSKMICGLIIDVSQVVMLTFVNSFKDVAGTNLTQMMGLNTITSMNANDANTDSDVTGWSILGAYVLAIIYIIISLITIITMVLMLAMRIVMMWIYVVLSPMAYLLGAFPDGQKYASKWWTEFSQNVIVGPVLAFFIWLSFASLGGVTDQASIGGVTSAAPTGSEVTGSNNEGSESLTVAGSPNHMLNFVISIAMLYGGLQISQSIGGAAGGMAGKGISAINQGKGMITKPIMAGALAAGLYAKGKGIQGAKWTGRMGKTVLGGLDRMAGAKVDKWRKDKNGVIKKGPTFAGEGLVSTGAGFVVNRPKNWWNEKKAKWNKDDSLNQNLRTFGENKKRDKDAFLKHDSKEWDLQANGTFINRADTDEVLRDSKGRDVTELSPMKSAWQQAWRDTNGKAQSESSKKQEKEISEKQQQMADSNLTVDEMLQKFMRVSTSATEKMALAMTLAAKGAFENKDQVKAAKAAVGNNYVLGKKINDEIDKNQAHLNYDFQSPEGIAKFKARYDLGKIDGTSSKAAALGDNHYLAALESQLGPTEFLEVLKANVRKGGRKSSDAIEDGLKKMAAAAGGKGDNTEKNKKLAMAASISGKLEQIFTIDNNGTQTLDADAITHHFANSDARDVNKIDKAELEASFGLGGGLAGSVGAEIKSAVIDGLDVTKLSAMQAAGAKTDALRELIEAIMSSQGNDRKKADILANAKLRPLIDTKYIPPAPTTSTATSAPITTPAQSVNPAARSRRPGGSNYRPSNP
jgi:hypothetical protein